MFMHRMAYAGQRISERTSDIERFVALHGMKLCYEPIAYQEGQQAVSLLRLHERTEDRLEQLSIEVHSCCGD